MAASSGPTLAKIRAIEGVAVSQPEVVSSSIFGKSFHVYTITTVPKVTDAVVKHRYSHFDWLRAVLADSHRDVAFRPLPPKDMNLQMLGIATDRVFLESRRSGLEKFLQSIVRREDVVASPAVVGFLTLPIEEFEAKRAELEKRAHAMTLSVPPAMLRTRSRKESKSAADYPPMPGEASVNAQFEQYLKTNKGIYKPEAEDNMRKMLPAKQKWQMVCDAKDKTPEETRAEVQEVIARLRESANPKPRMIQELRAVLRSRDKRWMTLWFEIGGARDLAAIIHTCSIGEVQREAVETLYQLINIRLGMEYFCADASKALGDRLHTLTSLVLSLPRTDNKAAVMALKLLCAVANEYPKALEAVFAKVFRSRPRYWILVDLARGVLDCHVKLWAVCLINSIILSEARLEPRMALRRCFIDLELETVLDAIDLDAVERESGLETSSPLQNQISLYHEALREDRMETTRLQTDLSDPVSVMQAVHSNASDQGCAHLLLSSLHTMLLLPSSDHGETVWHKLDWFLHGLVKRSLAQMEGKESKEKDFAEMSYAELGDVLERQAGEDKKWKKSELKRLRDQVDALEKKLLEARAHGGGGGVPPPPSLGPGVPPPPGMGIPPPPGGGGGAGGVPPPPGGIPPPPGMGGIPPPPGGGGMIPAPPGAIPPPPGMGGLPPPPGMGGLPPPPGLLGAPAAAKPSKPKCPAKKKLKPAKKMKALHWNRLTNEAAYETVWKELGKGDEAIVEKLDLILMEESFADEPRKKKKKKKPDAGRKSVSSPRKKVKLVELLDSKRRQAVDIALRGLKLSGDQVTNAMLKMDRKVLTQNLLPMLANACPTDAEVDLLKSYSGPTEELGSAERFMRVVSIVPNLPTRLQMMIFKEGYGDQVKVCRNGVGAVNSALRMIDTSKNLKTVLKVVLAVGNYINGGTKKGAAWGFKLNTFSKLKMLRSNDGKHHLVHFIADTVRSKFRPALAFLEDLGDVSAASGNDTAWLEGEAMKIESSVRRLENEVKKKHYAANDRFPAEMHKFHVKAVGEVKALVTEAKKMGTVTQRLCKQYGEKKCRPEELLAKFATFVVEFRRALHEIDKEEADKADQERRKRELEDRKRRITQDQGRRKKEEKNPEKKQLALPTQTQLQRRNKNLVDSVVKDLTACSVRDMLRKVKRKRRESMSKLKL